MLTEEELAILAALQLDWEDDEDDGATAPHRRSLQTEKRYRYVAELIMRRSGTRERPGTIKDAIELVVSLSPSLRHSTVRQYRAAMLQILRDLYRAGGIELRHAGQFVRRLGLIDAAPLPHGDRRILLKRCGAGCRRGLQERAQRDTVYRLRALNTEMSQTLADLLDLGEMVGLRPWEWPNAVVKGQTLFIRSAKMSGWMRRGLVDIRRLDLRPLGDETIATIAAICKSLRADLAQLKTVERVMARYARLLRKHRLDPLLSLRSIRHQFRKNAQSMGWTAGAIAVAMNHSSAESQHAYGRDTTGRRGISLPNIDMSLLQYVSPSRPHAQERKADHFLNSLRDEIVEDQFTGYVPRK